MARVLVICTGGTFTMVNTEQGYVSQKGIIKRLKKFTNLYDKEYSLKQNIDKNECITPMTPFGNRIFYRVEEFEELLDSSNLTLKEQIKMAEMIKKNYFKFDAFIILHGTDTMAYTASSLSFMLENLNKPVILTGS
jgi:60kDa lysophospholipase